MNQYISHTWAWALVALVSLPGFSYFVLSGTAYVDDAASSLSAEVSNQYVALARADITGVYNPLSALDKYRKALQAEPANKDAVLEIARTHTALGNIKNAQAFADRFIQNFPDDTRGYYVAGVATGFLGDYAASAKYFEEYIAKTTTSKWQSRLDLAWVYYQQGKYTEAKQVIDNAVDMFGTNTWISTSKAAIEHALGNVAEAKTAIDTAAKEVETITPNEWNHNYVFNGTKHFDSGIKQMRTVIAYNKALIDGEAVAAPDRKDFSRMVGFAPDEGKGLAVSACGETCGPVACTSPPNSCGAVQTWTINNCDGSTCSVGTPPPVPERYGQSCTSINLCGIQASGTVQCDGRCSASAPLPTAFGQGCTIRNRCGSANGTVGCNGQCNVARYPTCLNPDDSVTGGDDGWTEVTINDDGRFTGQNYGNIGVQISVSPSLVRSGQRTVVRWNSNEMNSCTVTGTNGDTWTGLQGEEITRPITLRVTYTISCTAFDGRVLTDTAIVGLAPVMCEIGQVGCEQQ